MSTKVNVYGACGYGSEPDADGYRDVSSATCHSTFPLISETCPCVCVCRG